MEEFSQHNPSKTKLHGIINIPHSTTYLDYCQDLSIVYSWLVYIFCPKQSALWLQTLNLMHISGKIPTVVSSGPKKGSVLKFLIRSPTAKRLYHSSCHKIQETQFSLNAMQVGVPGVEELGSPANRSSPILTNIFSILANLQIYQAKMASGFNHISLVISKLKHFCLLFTG